AAAASLVIALGVGSADVPPARVLETLAGGGSALDQALILDLRLPRALTAFAVGGLLALAGALIQVLLRNPLGDPYVLGVSGGAATGALLAMLAGAATLGVSGAALVGALASTLGVFALARAPGLAWTPTRLLLTGVVAAAGWSALISFILSLSPAARLPGMLFWLMGDLGSARTPAPPLALLATGLGVGIAAAPRLNVLARGDLRAAALGVRVERLRTGIYFAAAALTAGAVVQAGSVGFVGLVSPHLVRLMGGRDHRLLLPGAVLLGGALLTLADTLARTLLAPRQLPVGVLTALLGVPVFLYLLNRSRAW
ncbi:MAG: iron ABC transporter permease, partial [Chromatiales bacterium]